MYIKYKFFLIKINHQLERIIQKIELILIIIYNIISYLEFIVNCVLEEKVIQWKVIIT